MLDGLGMAETTPGPADHGAAVRRLHGGVSRSGRALADAGRARSAGLLATWVTFTPCFLWIFLGAPFVEMLRGNKALNGALSAITAAVVGVVLNLAIWFAIHTVFRETMPVRAFPLSFDAPKLTSVDPWALVLSHRGRHRDLSVQGRHDPDARGVLCWRASFSICWGRSCDRSSIAFRMMSAAILAASVIAHARAVEAGTSIDFGQNRIGLAPPKTSISRSPAKGRLINGRRS